MTQDLVTNWCERCGQGQTFNCFFAMVPNNVTDVMVVCEDPIHQIPIQHERMQSRLQAAGVDLSRIVWTGAKKCVDKSFTVAGKHCRNWLHHEIALYRPRVVVSVGKKALKALIKQESHDKHVGRVFRRECEGAPVPYWHLHIRDSWELDKFPEYVLDEERILGKITKILSGEYPKNPAEGKNYQLIQSIAQLQSWLTIYSSPEYCAFDIETGGWDEDEEVGCGHDPWHPDSHILGCSLSFHPNHACYVDFRAIGADMAAQFVINWLRNNNKKLILHNGKFDLMFFWVKHNLNAFDLFYMDTMLADGLLREFSKSHGLKQCAERYLPEFEDYDKPLTDFFAGVPDNKKDYAQIPIELITPYACMDADVTLRLFYLFAANLQAANMWGTMRHMMGVQDAYAEMEYNGWGHDRSVWQGLQQDTTREINEKMSVLQRTPHWHRYRGYREAEERTTGKGKAFWDEGTQQVFTDSSCLEFAEASFMHRNGARKKTRTYTHEDIEPDVNNDRFKRTILYHDQFLNLPITRRTDKAKEPSVSKAALNDLRRHPRVNDEAKAIVAAMAELQTLNKRKTSFIDPVFPHTNDKGVRKLGWLRGDGLIHPHYLFSGQDWGDDFKEGGTNSGRSSCIDPNMQQQPTRKGGKKFKRQFRPAPRDVHGRLFQAIEGGVMYSDPNGEPWYFIQLDYSQLELRVLAELANEPFMMDAYMNGEDLHTGLASQLFNKPMEWLQERLDDDDHPEHDLAFNYRLIAKTSWFAVLYGSGASNLVDILGQMEVDLTLTEAEEIIATLYSKLPMVAALKQQVAANGCVVTNPFGRRRVVLNLNSIDNHISSKAGRQLFNFLIQSTGSDIASTGIVRSVAWLREQKKLHNLRAYPVGAVHDSFILAVPESELQYVAHHVKRLMEDTSALPWQPRVPIRVDVEYGPNWGDLRTLELGAAA